ncbi:hypothetical protein GobsT_68960 [Gemmata obscuriglobus]|uniref:TIGR03000 domain-containing protein n=1 Tax=Gemmata obscuriglobus TaxID=114 RepID=A0A2Z3H7F4_9BACT|nr:hypothetical protein [Gemmata obscuriglobus]AWM41973.1 hypothetical protein C1280_36590 [Gemmata obscuriglobus]QEG32046.1 hypothetical protein GobsT_68960 [Gemmata obscuriglobus]VTS11396.1 unnamed protein product [Gemmata obscuriglobus UQM 2246]
MKRFVFAGALVALAAPFTVAEEKPAATPPAAPAVAAAPVVESAPVVTTAAPARRGLFGRLRNRGTTTYAVPVTGTTVVPPGTVITPAPATAAPAPTPMPMPKPKVDTKTDTAAASSEITLGNFVATADPVVVQASATETAKSRRGLFSRLRSR